MKYKVNKNTHPVYLQIYKQIKEDIINGYYPYNTKLPSKRLLADETDTSTVTIEHAYALLCDEGYVESRERSGFLSYSERQTDLHYPQKITSAIPKIIVSTTLIPNFHSLYLPKQCER